MSEQAQRELVQDELRHVLFETYLSVAVRQLAEACDESSGEITEGSHVFKWSFERNPQQK